MSVASLVRRKGSTASLYAPVAVRNPDGSPGKPTWTLLGTAQRLLFQPITDELADKVYGLKGVVRERAWYTGTLALEPGHGIVVTAGHRNGKRFRVEEILDYDAGSTNAHRELAVTETTEAIP